MYVFSVSKNIQPVKVALFQWISSWNFWENLYLLHRIWKTKLLMRNFQYSVICVSTNQIAHIVVISISIFKNKTTTINYIGCGVKNATMSNCIFWRLLIVDGHTPCSAIIFFYHRNFGIEFFRFCPKLPNLDQNPTIDLVKTVGNMVEND